MIKYREYDIQRRLGSLDRRSKATFAALCAQSILPLFVRYCQESQAPQKLHFLQEALDRVWGAIEGEDFDISGDQARVESMVPSDEDEWNDGVAYAQNVVASVAYAIRTWLTDSSQEAAWAARQVYEAADLAAQRISGIMENDPNFEVSISESAIVQHALGSLNNFLAGIESMQSIYKRLKVDATSSGDAISTGYP